MHPPSHFLHLLPPPNKHATVLISRFQIPHWIKRDQIKNTQKSQLYISRDPRRSFGVQHRDWLIAVEDRLLPLLTFNVVFGRNETPVRLRRNYH